MKRLKAYYLYLGIPIALLVLCTFVFLDAILGTVRGNPHPQINYIIFALIAVGCVQMLGHVRRINREGRLFARYYTMTQSGIADEQIDLVLRDLSMKDDVTPLIQLVQGLRKSPLNTVQHAAVESELERFAARQARRLMMAQFMGGMMVGMGLLGTFIGLLGALEEIGTLIGSFNLGAGMTDPVAAISELVARLTAPMKAMGVAFSASLFGVLGSLIMGVLMVGVRGASSDLVSFVQSDTALMLEITRTGEGDQSAEKQVTQAMAQLAENAPLLRGLAVALDHSERRVRELLEGVGNLASRIEASSHVGTTLSELVQKQDRLQHALVGAVGHLQQAQSLQSERQAHLVTALEVMGQQAGTHTELIRTAFEQQNERLDRQLNELQQLWREQGLLQQRALETQREHWQAQSQQEQKVRSHEWARWTDVQQGGLQQMSAFLQAAQRSLEHMRQDRGQEASRQEELQTRQQEQHDALTSAIRASADTVQRDLEVRAQMLARIDALLQETQLRNEQVVRLVALSAAPVDKETT